MQNKLSDLNNHLFAQLERLGDEELSGDRLIEELARAKSIANVSSQIIQLGSLALKAEQLKYDTNGESRGLALLTGET